MSGKEKKCGFSIVRNRGDYDNLKQYSKLDKAFKTGTLRLKFDRSSFRVCLLEDAPRGEIHPGPDRCSYSQNMVNNLAIMGSGQVERIARHGKRIGQFLSTKRSKKELENIKERSRMLDTVPYYILQFIWDIPEDTECSYCAFYTEFKKGWGCGLKVYAEKKNVRVSRFVPFNCLMYPLKLKISTNKKQLLITSEEPPGLIEEKRQAIKFKDTVLSRFYPYIEDYLPGGLGDLIYHKAKKAFRQL